jgi:hypothetical protein
VRAKRINTGYGNNSHLGREAEEMDAALDLQTEMANLARRIVGPVAAKVPQNDLDTAVGHIRHAFEQLNSKSVGANADFENMAANILEPMRATLSEANFARIVDRLRGAMVGFCQRDDAEAQFDAEPLSLQQDGQRETLQPQLTGQSEPDTAEPWWSKSGEVTLLILLWVCTEIRRQWS